MTPSIDLRERVLAAVRETPVPARPGRVASRALSVALAALTMVAPLLVEGGLANAAGRPWVDAVGVVAGVAIVALLSTAAVLPRQGSMLGQPRLVLIATVVSVPLAIGAWTVLWHWGYDDPFERLGVRCFALALAAAIGPFVALGRRGADPVHGTLAGAARGAAAGAWAGVVVAIWCPLAEPTHVLRGHVLPFVVLIAIGALVGAREVARRPWLARAL